MKRQRQDFQERSLKFAALNDEASTTTSPILSKEDLLQQIFHVDASIMALHDKKTVLLKKKDQILSELNNIKVTEEMHVDIKPTISELAQKIYAENKARALESHEMLSSFNYIGELQ